MKRRVPGPIVSAWIEPWARSKSPVPPVTALSKDGGGPGFRWPQVEGDPERVAAPDGQVSPKPSSHPLASDRHALSEAIQSA